MGISLTVCVKNPLPTVAGEDPGRSSSRREIFLAFRSNISIWAYPILGEADLFGSWGNQVENFPSFTLLHFLTPAANCACYKPRSSLADYYPRLLLRSTRARIKPPQHPSSSCAHSTKPSRSYCHLCHIHMPYADVITECPHFCRRRDLFWELPHLVLFASSRGYFHLSYPS